MKLCFATNNKHKLQEIRQLLGGWFTVLSLEDIGCREELPENQTTLEGNSLEKAQYIWEHYQVNCFADDTGLEVEALNGAPGVYSARYAGLQRDNEANMALLLENLQSKNNRNAQFRTSITLIMDGQVHQFEGVVKGKIAWQHTGMQGFGYDPLFIPEGYTKTFAEMDMAEKNSISHRGKAIARLVEFLKRHMP